MAEIDCTPACGPNEVLPVPGVNPPCPIPCDGSNNLIPGGEVCWTSGETSGRALVIYDSLSGTTTYVDILTGDVIPAEDIVDCPLITQPVEIVNDWAAINGVVSHTVANAAGATAAGLQSVTFTNVGTTAGSVGGASIAVGESITFNGYADPVLRQYVRIPSIAYVASATALLSISTIA